MENDPAHPTKPYRYSSTNLSVQCGGSVEIMNNSTATHTFSPAHGGFTTSGNVSAGDSSSVTFFYKGTFGFMCDIHPWMTGSIHVT
jgi:plastocyanin